MNTFTRAATGAGLLLLCACSENAVQPQPEPEPTRVVVAGPASLYKGATAQYTATVTGGSGAHGALAWTSADTMIAVVDETGLVRGRSPGTVSISASTGIASHSATVVVQDDALPPSVADFSADPATVDVSSENATITFTVRALDAAAGIASVRVSLRSVNTSLEHPLQRCETSTPVSGTANDGTWRCSVTLDRYVDEGEWFARATATDRAGNRTSGRGMEIGVRGQLPDTTAPLLQRMWLDPDSVDVRDEAGQLGIHFQASDGEAGIAAIGIAYGEGWGSDTPSLYLVLPRSGTIRDGVWSWYPTFPKGAEPRTFKINTIHVVDFSSNWIMLTREQLRELGFPVDGTVTR